MRVVVFSVCYNRAFILPWFLRHYETIADEISVFDDKSDDGSREMLSRHPKVILRDWPYDDGLNDDHFLEHAYEWYPKARGHFDWVIWVDTDEFIYHPQLRAVLETSKDVELLPTVGFNMTGVGLPQDDGKSQIYDLNPMGVWAPVYAKPVVFRPEAHIRWRRGKQELEGCSPKMASRPTLKLLHYRYLGYDHTARTNALNLQRCSLKTGDKSSAWSCQLSHTGEHSPEWSEIARAKSFNVLTDYKL